MLRTIAFGLVLLASSPAARGRPTHASSTFILPLTGEAALVGTAE